MRAPRRISAAVLAFGFLAALVSSTACGKYGRPRRSSESAAASPPSTAVVADATPFAGRLR